MKYRRILLKLSGEAFSKGTVPFEFDSIDYVVEEIKSIANQVEIGVVVGGGNIWRGAKRKEIQRVASDYIGMYATVLNGLVLKEKLKVFGIEADVFSAISSGHGLLADEPELVNKTLNSKNIAVFVGGTGHPYLTTDTAAALRAVEICAEVLIKATQVDGIYDSDPKENPHAKIYKFLSYDEALKKNLKVMDATAFSLCRDNNLPIIVYNLYRKGSLKKILLGEEIGTIVSERNE